MYSLQDSNKLPAITYCNCFDIILCLHLSWFKLQNEFEPILNMRSFGGSIHKYYIRDSMIPSYPDVSRRDKNYLKHLFAITTIQNM